MISSSVAVDLTPSTSESGRWGTIRIPLAEAEVVFDRCGERSHIINHNLPSIIIKKGEMAQGPFKEAAEGLSESGFICIINI